jgi:hypothetical protein
MSALRRFAAALRGFAQGFLGLGAPPHEGPGAARDRIRDTAERRPRCC